MQAQHNKGKLKSKGYPLTNKQELNNSYEERNMYAGYGGMACGL